MRILELEIANIRGIRAQHFSLQGKSAVVLGPNGAGKSAVIDSIEFLLSGRIGRLTGEGTGEISFREHGPHVDSPPEDAWVRAVVEIHGEDDPIEFKRHASSPATVEVVRGSRDVLQASLAAATKTQHVLTRRDLLAFVTADGGTRAKRIEALLDITEIGRVRSALVRARNELGRDAEAAAAAQGAVEDRLASHVGTGAFDSLRALEFTNELRATLGVPPIGALVSGDIRGDLDHPAPTASVEGSVRAAAVAPACAAAREALELLTDRVSDRQARTDALRRVIGDRGIAEIRRAELVNEGLANLSGDSCPLCEVEWDEDELRARLETRAAALGAAREVLAAVREACGAVESSLGVIAASLSTIAEAVEGLSPDFSGQVADAAALTLDAKQATHLPPLDELESWDFPIGAGIEIPAVLQLLEQANSLAEDQPVSDAQARAAAWEALTQIEESLATREDLARRSRRAAECGRQARILLTEFEESRDATLGMIYNEITDRFRGLYTALHSEEPDFSASLRPDEAALHLRVSFHGRGDHVPHALHSEGHQDSMGVCLFLALAERFGSGVLEILLLDDVMMSVDADHRRSLANLLADEFGELQMVITTHDRQWAKQLQRAGVVARRAIHEFKDWSIDTGPLVVGHQQGFDRARSDLAEGSVHQAAHGVRRALEGAFLEICDELAALVPFSLTGRHELGDLLPAATRRIRDLIKEGKKRANEHAQADVMERLSALEDRIVEAASTLQSEQWAINPAVHYNTWENLAPNELGPILMASEDLVDLFHCPSCDGPLRLATVSGIEASVICACGESSWSI